jgi:hypothetical protein
MLFLDADVLIDFERGWEPAIAWFEALEETPSVPGYVAMELLQDVRDAQQLQKTERFLKRLPLVWPKEDACNEAYERFGMLHLSHGVGLLDCPIGYTVLAAGGTLCTFNVKHYRAIEGLQTRQPYDKGAVR